MISMQSRLDLIAPDIAQAIAAVPQPRRIALLACEIAVRANRDLPKQVASAVAALARGRHPGIDKARLALRPVIHELDATYLAEYERSGERNTPAVLAAFSRARAANAVLAALDPDAAAAAPEAIYEAHAALSDEDWGHLLERVRRAARKA